jgi:8-oxo-dGTP pyrophosphatase MutT (NUDIX family)
MSDRPTNQPAANQSGGGEPRPLLQAATVLLLRDGPSGVEVLMVHRHAEMHFGDAWVFPGGKIDAADSDTSLLSRFSEEQCTRCMQRLAVAGAPAASQEIAIALHVAACREVFEETGLLLAACTAEQITRIQSQCAAIAARSGAFAELLAAENLQLNLDQLTYWTHWITPSGSPKRFDTRFFAVQAPAGQDVLADSSESSEFVWIAPAKMIAERSNMNATVLPPTMLTLMDLAACAARHDSVAAMLASEAGRKAIVIMPKLQRDGEATMTIYPWDRDYSALPGEGVALMDELPNHLRDLPSRLVLSRRGGK